MYTDSHLLIKNNNYVAITCSVKSFSATTVLSSVTLHTYRGQFDWQTIVFMNMCEAGGGGNKSLHEISCYNKILFSMTSFWDFLT